MLWKKPEYSKLIANYIIQHNKTLDNDDAGLSYPLLTAAEKQDHESAELYIKAGATYYFATYFVTSNNALHCAVTHKDIPMVKLLTSGGESYDKINKEKKTPLDLAFETSLKCAEVIVDNTKPSADVLKIYGRYLPKSAKFKRTKLCRKLIEAGVDLNKTWDGNTSLHWAVIKENIELIKLLIQHKADQSKVNSLGMTPIEFAAHENNADMVELFLSENKNLNAKEMRALHYEEALIHVIKNNNVRLVKLFLDKNVTVEKSNNELGVIAIYWALKNDNEKILQLLLQKIDKNLLLENHEGKSILDCAEELSAIKCFKILNTATPTYVNTIIEKQPETIIDKYKIYLQNLDEEIATHKWDDKDFLGYPTIPNHIKRITPILETIDYANEESIRKAFIKVATEFTNLKPARSRAHTTNQFDKEQINKIKNITEKNQLTSQSSPATITFTSFPATALNTDQTTLNAIPHSYPVANANLVPIQPVYIGCYPNTGALSEIQQPVVNAHVYPTMPFNQSFSLPTSSDPYAPMINNESPFVYYFENEVNPAVALEQNFIQQVENAQLIPLNQQYIAPSAPSQTNAVPSQQTSSIYLTQIPFLPSVPSSSVAKVSQGGMWGNNANQANVNIKTDMNERVQHVKYGMT